MIGLFGHFQKKGFYVFLLSLRAQISPVNGEGVGGMKKGEGGMSKGFT